MTKVPEEKRNILDENMDTLKDQGGGGGRGGGGWLSLRFIYPTKYYKISVTSLIQDLVGLKLMVSLERLFEQVN